jgi:hypothetical protein
MRRLEVIEHIEMDFYPLKSFARALVPGKPPASRRSSPDASRLARCVIVPTALGMLRSSAVNVRLKRLDLPAMP